MEHVSFVLAIGDHRLELLLSAMTPELVFINTGPRVETDPREMSKSLRVEVALLWMHPVSGRDGCRHASYSRTELRFVGNFLAP